jgi:squalene synthase HpnC
MNLAEIELDIARNLPEPGCSVQRAEEYTRHLATSHYENFTVATYLLPKQLRQPFCNVYAYCRWADDLGDEIGDTAKSLELLDWWGNELEKCYSGTSSHPVFIALHQTVHQFNIPIVPFSDLLIAFRQDQTVQRYPTWGDVLQYCKYSANPVGRLVLYLCGYRDAERQELSDFTCTALQLANFWQDVSRDLDKNRIYIPIDMLHTCELTEADLFNRNFDSRYPRLMQVLVDKTRELFNRGVPLTQLVDSKIRVDIDLFSRCGIALLDSIEAIGYNTLQHRPSLDAKAKLKLIGRAVGEHVLSYARR